MEEHRMKYTLMATNPQMYLTLYEEKQENEPEEFTPRTAEDIEAVLRELESLEGSESYNEF